MSRFEKLDNDISACMKCGFCKAVCPVFFEEETTSPRAKVRLARAVARGEMTLTQGIKRQMERCLGCMACAIECPSGVEPNRIALFMRSEYVVQEGLPIIKRFMFRRALRNPRMAALVSRLLGLAQHILAIDLQNNPLRLLLPLIGMRKDKDLPVMGRRSLFSIVPEIVEPIGEEKIRVLYFPGCAINLIYPEMGLATLEILQKLGAMVLIPHDLVCCSRPVFSSGDIVGAGWLARRNIEIMAFVPVDYIVTSCGSCGLTISREWTEVLEIPEAATIGAKTIDISTFVAKYASENSFRQLEGDEVVTYHDSCHLNRGMKVHDEPRQLLKAAVGNRFVEMESADRCCGGAGTFSLYHPELSQEVAEVKMCRLAESKADIIAAGCPACVMQLRDSLVHRSMQQRAIHTVDIVNRAMHFASLHSS
jgi:glycolate oxidase iron-sulfur subunit